MKKTHDILLAALSIILLACFPSTAIASSVLDGIDISHHQGDVDWKLVAKQKRIQYVYLKATEGSDLRDRKYREHIQAARKAGFKVGAYHYMTMSSSARQQFNNFKKLVGNDIDLIPMIDLEMERSRFKLSAIRQKADSLIRLFENHYGVKPMLYCGVGHYYILCDDDYAGTEPLHVLKKYRGYPIYWAHYTSRQPRFATKNRCVIWQYTHRGKVNGIRGWVDLSRFINNHSLNEIMMPRAKRRR